jgi:GntR family transcriptional regulator
MQSEATMHTVGIDRASHVPIYQQIKLTLLRELQEGKFDAGESKLTEDALMQRFRVSRAPVRQALNALVGEGYLYRERAKGTYPTPAAVRNSSRRFGELVLHLRDQGLDPESRVSDVGRVRPSEPVCTLLGLGPEADVFGMTRLILVDGAPLVSVRTFLNVPESFNPSADELEAAGTVINVLERSEGITLTNAEYQIWATSASAEEAQALAIAAGDPILVTETTMFAKADTPIGWSRAIHQSDRYKYVFSMSR